MSGDIRRMDEGQLRRVKKLIRGLCANCDGGDCLLLDDGEAHVCPQLITYSLLCRYFRAAVLPARPGSCTPTSWSGTPGSGAPTAARPSSPPGSRGVFCPRCARPCGSAAARPSGRGGIGAGSRRLGPLNPLIYGAFQRRNRGCPTHFP